MRVSRDRRYFIAIFAITSSGDEINAQFSSLFKYRNIVCVRSEDLMNSQIVKNSYTRTPNRTLLYDSVRINIINKKLASDSLYLISRYRSR